MRVNPAPENAPKLLSEVELFDTIRLAVRDAMTETEAINIEREFCKQPLISIDDGLPYVMAKVRYAMRGHLSAQSARERQYAELVAAAEEIASIKHQGYIHVIRVPEEWVKRLDAALAALSPVSPAESTKGERP